MTNVEQLVSIVEEMLHEHETLLALAYEKKEILIQGDMKGLEKVTGQELTLIQRIEALEKQRVAWGHQMAQEKGIPFEQLTAGKVAELCQDPALAHRMERITDSFARVMKELERVNDLNGQLLRQSLAFVQMTLDAITETPMVTRYHQQGETVPAAPRRHLFDAKV